MNTSVYTTSVSEKLSTEVVTTATAAGANTRALTVSQAHGNSFTLNIPLLLRTTSDVGCIVPSLRR